MHHRPDPRAIARLAFMSLVCVPACDKDKPESADTNTSAEPTGTANALVAQAGNDKELSDKNCCMGLNDCKGKGGCAVPESNACAGKNECAGKGGCRHRDCSKTEKK